MMVHPMNLLQLPMVSKYYLASFHLPAVTVIISSYAWQCRMLLSSQVDFIGLFTSQLQPAKNGQV